MYHALEIAKYVIDKCFKEGAPVTNLRLQKLLYFIQLESYKKNTIFMFDDDLYAWQFGPVVPEVYYEYNMYGGSPILLHYDTLNIKLNDRILINQVIREKNNTPIWQLVTNTHKEGGPWFITVNEFGLRTAIGKKLIIKEAERV